MDYKKMSVELQKRKDLTDFTKMDGWETFIWQYEMYRTLKKELKPKKDNKSKRLNVIPYQRCPICDGLGKIPNLNSDLTSVSNISITCDVCNGLKIIPMCVLTKN